MADDIIGSLRINVSADLSDLQDELAKIPGLVADAIAGLTSAGSGGDAFDATAGLFEATGTAAATATPEIEGAAAAMAGAGAAAAEAGPSLEGVHEAVVSAAEGFKGLLEQVGLAVGAFEILKESLGAFSQAQDLISSFTLLSGSAEAATQAFDQLREMSDKLGISTEQMLTVAQRLAPVFGVGTDSATAVLTAAADAAKAAGVPFETVAFSLDRIQSSGQLTSRQLLAMGISMEQVAETMSNMAGRTITVADAMELLKKGAMDAATDTKVAIQTIEDNMGGAAEQISQNLSGQFQELNNMMHEVALSIGDAIAPLAADIISTFRDFEPTLIAIGSGAKAAALGFEGLGDSIGGVVPEFVKIVLSAEGMISLGTAIGFVAQAAKTLVDVLHATVLELTDIVSSLNPFGDGMKNLIADFDQAGAVIGKDIQGFGDIATAGDKMAQSLKTSAAMAKAAIGDILPSGDTFAGVGGSSSGSTAPPPDFTDQLKAAADAKKVLAQAAADLNKADADYAEFLKATYIPAILTVEQAQQNVADTEAAYTAAAKAEADTRTAIAMTDQKDTATLTDLEATFGKQVQETALAHDAYTQALKDQTLSKTTLANVTKDLDSAEAAIASATKSTYIPTIIDHATALQNIADAENAQQLAIQNVRDAESALSEAYANATKDANGNVISSTALKDAEDNLAASKVALVAATAKVTQAHKDETTSATLLKSVVSALDQAEKDSITTKQKLAPAETDLTKAVAAYMQALKDVKDASDAEADAANNLRIAQDSSDPTTQTDALNKFKTAHDNVTVATKGLDAATQILTSDFKIGSDALSDLKAHTDDWSLSQDKATAELSTLGIPALQALQDKAKSAADAYADLASRGFANNTIALEANVAQQNAAIAAAVQMGLDTTNMRIDLDTTTQALQRQTDGLATMAKALQGVELSGLTNAFHDLLFDIGSIGDAFTKLGESMVDIVVNQILKDALTPLLNAMDKLIAQGVTWLEDMLGIGGSGGGVLGTSVGAAGGAAATTANTSAITANTAALTALTSAVSSASGVGAATGAGDASGGGGSSSGGGLLGSITGIVGAIGSIATAIGTFVEGSATNAKLFTIETDMAMLVRIFDGADGMMYWTKAGMESISLRLPDMVGVLNDIRSHLANIEIDAGFIQTLPQALQGIFQSVTGHVYLDGQELFASFVNYLTQAGIKMPQS